MPKTYHNIDVSVFLNLKHNKYSLVTSLKHETMYFYLQHSMIICKFSAIK
jgi:hypothetical protein